MQWVVTTGRTVAEARDRALDALGVDESDLEYAVLNEASSSLFGLRRIDARIRARVRPTTPRPKVDRRTRRKGRKRQRGQKDSAKDAGRQNSEDWRDEDASDSGPAKRGRTKSKTGGGSRRAARTDSDAAAEQTSARDDRPVASPPPVSSAVRGAPRDATSPATADATTSPGATSMSDITLDEQEPAAVEFLTGLLRAFEADADVAVDRPDDETIEIAITGSDLGLLVGQRGNTLQAIQELTRTSVAQQLSGRLDGRLRIDIAGYRARRKEALVRFATEQAEKVAETGEQVALEPMSPPDRKIVHDTVNEIDGVRTESRGEDRRRHIVILPD